MRLSKQLSHVFAVIFAFTIVAQAENGYTGTQSAERGIWIASLPIGRENLVDVFNNEARWLQLQSKVKYFKIYSNFVRHYNDEQLRIILKTISRLGYKLSIEGPALVADPRPEMEKCTKGVESFAPSNELLNVLMRISSLGGTVDSISMDEPIWYTLVKPKFSECKYSIEEIASQVYTEFFKWRRIFPNVEVGLIEPSSIDPSLVKLLDDELFSKFGIKLAFFHIDVMWNMQYLTEVRRLYDSLHGSLHVGLILDGGSWNSDCAIWAASSRARFDTLYLDLLSKNIDLIFQSWMVCPKSFEPESDLNTLGSFALYVADKLAGASKTPSP